MEPSEESGASSEAVLLANLKAGDEKAWDEVFPRLKEAALEVIRHLVRRDPKIDREGLASKAIGEVLFPKLMDGRFEVESYAKLINLTRSIARNQSLDAIRTRARRKETGLVEGFEPIDESSDPLSQIASESRFEQMIATLSEVQRLVFQMKLVDGCTYKEIAAILNEPQGTVACHYSRGLKKLREEGDWE
ncbi:MAG: RNA polymerase sigma factor [Verrucomicrobiota bacterium]